MNKIEMLDAGIYLVFYYSSATKFSNYSVRCQVCVVPLIILALRTCMKHRLWTFQWWKFSFCFWSSVCHDRIVWLPAIECEMNEWFMSSNPLSTHGKWNFLVFAIHAKPIEENDLGYKKKTSQTFRILFTGSSTPIRHISLRSLLPNTDSFMTYEGSTTHPGCWESTVWIIINKPIYITKQEVSYHSLYMTI